MIGNLGGQLTDVVISQNHVRFAVIEFGVRIPG